MNKDIVMKALRTQIKFNEKRISEMQQTIDKLTQESQIIRKEIDIVANEK